MCRARSGWEETEKQISEIVDFRKYNGQIIQLAAKHRKANGFQSG